MCTLRWVIREMKELLSNTFNWAQSFDDPRLPMDAMYIFGKKEPGRKSIERHINKTKQKFRNQFLERKALDSESTLHGEWKPASSVISQQLTLKLKEPPVLYFYPFAIYDVTFNKGKDHSQSQLALLLEVPSKQDIETFQPIKIMLAPHGCKFIPQDAIVKDDTQQTRQNLLQQDWRESTIGAAMPRVQKLTNCMRGKRQQYGL
jgi:hypothetical protein